MKTFVKILRWIWEFPQCLLGLILTKVYKVEYKEEFKGASVYAGEFPGGISLGQYILINERSYRDTQKRVQRHEGGHTCQSKILGWLYLPIVGLLSITWAGIHNYVAKNKSYYWFITEKGADWHAGINR